LEPDFQVNSHTVLHQSAPGVATGSAGNVVVVWGSDFGTGGDLFFSIEAQPFNAAGAPSGSEFQVNTYAYGVQYLAAVGGGGAEGFVVTWGSNGDFESQTNIHARRLNSDGSPLGSDFQVNIYTTLYQTRPAVALDAAGNFVVAWVSQGSSGDDTDGTSIQARRFDAGGAPLGPDFQVNTYATGHQSETAVASDATGNFVVVWSSYGSSGDDSSGYSIQARRFDAAGNPLGLGFQVNTYTTSWQRGPAVAAGPAGGFVVVWHSHGSSGGDNSDFSIQARRFDSAANPLGPDFQVNTITTSDQGSPRVAVEPSGNFVVVWSSNHSGGDDSDGTSIQVRRFNPAGFPLGPDFQVNTYTTGDQELPTVAVDAAGNFVVTWESYGSSGSDILGSSIQARRFRVPFFADGFESGDTSAWSAAVP
jgi:hypothetical protein